MSLSSFEGWCEKYLTARCIITKLGSDMIRYLLRLRWLWLWDWHRPGLGSSPSGARSIQTYWTFIDRIQIIKHREEFCILDCRRFFYQSFSVFPCLVIVFFLSLHCFPECGVLSSVCYVSHITCVCQFQCSGLGAGIVYRIHKVLIKIRRLYIDTEATDLSRKYC